MARRKGCGAPRGRTSSLRGKNSAAPERRSPAAPPEYLEGGTEQKNILFLILLKTIGSNRCLAAGALSVSFKNPWNYLAELPAEARREAPSEAANRLWWSILEKVRTHYEQNPDET